MSQGVCSSQLYFTHDKLRPGAVTGTAQVTSVARGDHLDHEPS